VYVVIIVFGEKNLNLLWSQFTHVVWVKVNCTVALCFVKVEGDIENVPTTTGRTTMRMNQEFVNSVSHHCYERDYTGRSTYRVVCVH